MNYELDRKMYDPSFPVRLMEESGNWRSKVGGAAADLVAVHPDSNLSLAESFPGLAIRQLVYYETDNQGAATVHVGPRRKGEKGFIQYDLDDLTYYTDPLRDTSQYTKEEWNSIANEKCRVQDIILELYRAGDLAAFKYMIRAAGFTGFHHAVHAAEPIDHFNPLWLPQMDIRNPLQLIRGTKQLLIPSTSNLLRWDQAMVSALRQTDVHPILRAPDEKLTYIGGRLSTLPMMAFIKQTPIKADIIAASQVEKWTALAAHQTMGSPDNICVCENDGVIAAAFSEQFSTLVVADTSDTPEFDVEVAIHRAALALEEHRGHPPQIIISERRPLEKSLYDRCYRALTLCGYRIAKSSVRSGDGGFLIIANPYDEFEAQLAGHFYSRKDMFTPVRLTQERPVPLEIQKQVKKRVPLAR